ncbi:hypothetical protein [Pelagerythrobacter sp.]|uniref:hypothetical protein n=1 Tax=Pelagerythrobacter sp. TaxID=2800702 RepID=UPI0035B47BA5
MIIKGIGLIGFGLLFVWLGASGWKHRHQERISLIEAAILKLGRAEPLPVNQWDRATAYLQPLLMLIFGPAMICLGLIVLLV